jgi:S1-C subfamily serine protease
MGLTRWLFVAAMVAIATHARAETVAETFKRVAGSVVVIRTSELEAPDRPGSVATNEAGLGSGVLIDKDRVLTAAHVVQVADTITVQLASGETLSARVLASEPSADLALLQLERAPMNVSIATLGDSDRVLVGDEVLVVGAPLGMSHTLSVGHISGRRVEQKLHGGFAGFELLQTDASINPGNSGGPMFDMSGNVVGIVSHIIFGEAGAGGLGFVATSNMAKTLLLSGKAMWSGMEGYVLEGDLARIFQLPQSRGVLVQRIAKGSPAAKIGLKPGDRKAMIGSEEFLVGGDVILEIHGVSLADSDSHARVRDLLDSLAPGTPIRLIVLRGGRRIELEWTPPKRSD